MHTEGPGFSSHVDQVLIVILVIVIVIIITTIPVTLTALCTELSGMPITSTASANQNSVNNIPHITCPTDVENPDTKLPLAVHKLYIFKIKV